MKVNFTPQPWFVSPRNKRTNRKCDIPPRKVITIQHYTTPTITHSISLKNRASLH
jgi:hypothetical protein